MDELRNAVAERVWARVDPATQRLRAGECAAIYQEIALELHVGWAAVRLRVPPEMRPSAVEEEAWRRLREQKPLQAACMGCGCDGCQHCARLERELGEFSEAEILATMTHATNVGGLSYLDLQHELWRREGTGQR